MRTCFMGHLVRLSIALLAGCVACPPAGAAEPSGQLVARTDFEVDPSYVPPAILGR